MKSAAALLFLLNLGLWAQKPNTSPPPDRTAQVGVDQQPDSESDAVMLDWLIMNGKTAERLVSLGVTKDVADSFVDAQEGDDALYPRWQTAASYAGQRFGLLFLPCHSYSDTAYLYALLRQNKAWRVTDHIEMDCHYDDNVS